MPNVRASSAAGVSATSSRSMASIEGWAHTVQRVPGRCPGDLDEFGHSPSPFAAPSIAMCPFYARPGLDAGDREPATANRQASI